MNIRTRMGTVAGCLLLAFHVAAVSAGVKLPRVLSDNMVLQRGRTIPIWGWAEPGEKVNVTAGGVSATAETDADGRWKVALPKIDVKGAFDVLVTGSSGSRAIIKNVLVGEVWLCTGPSNIFWPVRRCDNAKQEMAAAKFPRLRFFTVGKKTADKPLDDCTGRWVECSPGTVGDVSGVGYFFARRLHKEMDVPIGVLQSFWGGSRIESWTSRRALEAEPKLKPILDWWTQAKADFDPARAKETYQRELQTWQRAAARAKADGSKPPPKPRPSEPPTVSRHRPACLYNGMISPLVPYGMRGVIAYQGLGNLVWARYAHVLLPTMIRDLRRAWGQADLPFGMVQPAPYPCDRWPKGAPDAYSLLREAQLRTLRVIRHTGVAPTMDIGDLDELHFTNKQEVGRRMALWAMASVYDRPVACSGPIFRSMSIEDDAIRIRFDNAEHGLKTNDGRPPTCFVVAGADRKFHPARARIDGRTVMVRSDRVPRPVAVRFAWRDEDVPNLFNNEGLPASLFRTDDWSSDNVAAP